MKSPEGITSGQVGDWIVTQGTILQNKLQHTEGARNRRLKSPAPQSRSTFRSFCAEFRAAEGLWRDNGKAS